MRMSKSGKERLCPCYTPVGYLKLIIKVGPVLHWHQNTQLAYSSLMLPIADFMMV